MQLKEAYAFYGVIIVAMVVGLLLNFIHLDPIKALIYSAVGNGIVAPVILFFIVALSSSKKLMGEHANGRLSKTVGSLTIVLMLIAGVAALFALF